MQHRIVNCKFKCAEYTGICPKKLAHDQQKRNLINKKWQNITQMQHCLCIMPFLEVTILFNEHFIIVGNTVGKSPTGILHSNPIYLVLKPLKLQNSWCIFDRPVSSMYCKYAEFACKLQPNLSMNNKQCHNMQKNAISHFKYVEYAGIRHKTFSWSAKKYRSLKITEYAQKQCNIVIRRSKNASFTHI